MPRGVTARGTFAQDMTRRYALAPAVILLLLGLVWIGQGAGIIKGSFMTGSGFWLAVGVICVVASAGLGFFALRRPSKEA